MCSCWVRVSDGQELDLVVHRRGHLYDVDVDSVNGPVLRLRGFEMIETGPLPDGERFKAPTGGWPEGAVVRIEPDLRVRDLEAGCQRKRLQRSPGGKFQAST